LVAHANQALLKRAEMYRFMAEYTLHHGGTLVLQHLDIKSLDLLQKLTNMPSEVLRHQAAEIAKGLDNQGALAVVAPEDMDTFAANARQRAKARGTAWQRVVRTATTAARTVHKLLHYNDFVKGMTQLATSVGYMMGMRSLMPLAPVLLSNPVVSTVFAMLVVPKVISGLLQLPGINRLTKALSSSDNEEVTMTVDDWVTIILHQEALQQNLHQLGVWFDFKTHQFKPLAPSVLAHLQIQNLGASALEFWEVDQRAQALTSLMLIPDNNDQPYVQARTKTVKIIPGTGAAAKGGRLRRRVQRPHAPRGLARQRPLGDVPLADIEASF
jgi:hypothetical protein